MNKKFPLPTDAQYNNFAEYICEAHSWYKHIPLFEGGEFVFFLSEYAGGNYSKDSPRLHYARTTSEEYRRRFGYLDYAYRMCDEEYFHRDTSPELNIRLGKLGYGFNACPKNLEPCSVILYPFVSYDSDTLRCVILNNDLDEQLSVDNSHPNRNQIIKWLDECQKSVGIWNAISASEIDIVIQTDEIDLLEIDKYNLPANVIEYLKQEEIAYQPYRNLQSGELSKIRKALMNLKDLASKDLPVWY